MTTRKVLLDINTQVDCCFTLSKTSDATLSLWERHVEDAVKDHANTTIVGTMAFTQLSEKKKYLVRGTNGWMKLHETGVRRPLVVPYGSDHTDAVIGFLDTEVPHASGVYFEYPHMTTNNPFRYNHRCKTILSFIIARPTFDQRLEWYHGGKGLTINDPTEITVIGPKSEVGLVLFQFREWLETTFSNPEQVVKVTYVEPR